MDCGVDVMSLLTVSNSKFGLIRANALEPAEAWVASFRELRIALTLAVFTTVCAFIANIASPLPPVQEFGLALAVGVTSAFIASTVVVGALHVVVSRWSEAPVNNSSRRRLFEGDAKNITEFQKKTAAQVLVAVLLSAQCTDERVNKVTPELFKLACDPFKMQKVPVEMIYNIIRPCGLAPKKSKAISELSNILVKIMKRWVVVKNYRFFLKHQLECCSKEEKLV